MLPSEVPLLGPDRLLPAVELAGRRVAHPRERGSRPGWSTGAPTRVRLRPASRWPACRIAAAAARIPSSY